MKSKHVLNIKHGKKCICTQRYIVQYTITSCCITGLSYIITIGTVLYYHCTVLVVVVVSHIQRIGCQPEKTTLHGGQSRSWSAEQGKENKRKSLAAYCGSPNRKENSPNSSSTICCKQEPPPPSSPRPPRSCGLVPSFVQVQLPVSVHRLTCATLSSLSSLLRAPKLTSPGSFFVLSSKLFPHLPTSRKHSSLVLWSGSVGGCIRDTVEADKCLGSRAERVRCFGLKFVPNIFLSRNSTNRGTWLKRNCTRNILVEKK